MRDANRAGLLTASEMESRWDAQIGSIDVSFGEGRKGETASLIQRLRCDRVLVVSDPGIEAAGHLASLLPSLEEAGLQVALFTDVSENPTVEEVDRGLQFAAPHEPNCIVALGGGSVMDCAKGINFLLTNGGTMTDYWGFGKATHPLLPAVGIPSTAGTGSEAQSFALISDSVSHRKMACGDPSAKFRAVVLDPALLASAPRAVAAAAGIDAVGHALESFVSSESNPISRMLARQAWLLLMGHLEPSLEKQDSPIRSGQVFLGSHLAGAAIEQSMLGAAHACANPLTAGFGIAHGQAVALMLPHVVRYNSEAVDNRYRELAEIAGLSSGSGGGMAIADRLEEMTRRVGLADRLRQFGVTGSDLPELAESAVLEWTARFNPRPMGRSEFEALYRSAY